MKRMLAAVFSLFLINFTNSVLADPPVVRDRATIHDGIETSRNFSIPKPKYASCQALINTMQQKIFSQFLFEPTAQLVAAQDPECTTNPLLIYASDIAKRADDAARAAARGASTISRASNMARVKDLAATRTVSNSGFETLFQNNLDVISKMVRAMDEKQYGTFIRELGLVNGALACSSRNSSRVLDLLFAEILAASMEGGLDDPTEQQKCVQGTLNAALNTFDQLQYTGFSFIQTVLTKDNSQARSLLYPAYPVCDLGIWVYDFITGKLVQLRDEKACKAKFNSTVKDFFTSLKEGKHVSSKYRYLLGYLDEFADPRRFGLGYCSEYYVSGKKNFTCDVGVTCKNTAVNPDMRNIIEGVGESAAHRFDGSALNHLSGAISGQGKPTRFGLPVGVAEDFLCGRGVGMEGNYESHEFGAFGQPVLDMPGPGDLSTESKGQESNASRHFFQCQASVLFDTKIDPTTSCILSAMNNVMREEKRQSMPDGGRGPKDPSFVIGGVKDPSCTVGADPKKSKLDDWVHMKTKDASQDSPNFARNYATALGTAQVRLFNDTLSSIHWGFDDWSLVGTFLSAVTQTPIILRTPETGESSIVDAKVTSSSTSSTGYRITIFVDIKRTDDWASAMADALLKAFKEVAEKMMNDKSAKKNDSDQNAQPVNPDTPSNNQEPGPDQEVNSACTSAFDRALDTLRQCGVPNRSDQPGGGGRTHGENGFLGTDPRVTDPDPQGVGAVPPLGSIMAGLLACVDQYGKEVSAASGSQYGPGGCLSPMTLCNTTNCKTFESNCNQGQWQCSFALCREDTSCCGSPHTSRGGGAGDTPGNRTGNAIDCGDKIWNAAKRKCDDPNGCGDGWTFNAGTGLCEPLSEIPHGRGPGGPENPRDGNTIPNGNDLPGSCPPGTIRLPGSTVCVYP